MIDPWHELETGPAPPDVIHVVVENPKGTENKYEYDEKMWAIVLDRVLYSAVHYPGDYGFIPRTYDDDGDPLDVIVLVTHPTFPGCILRARPVGLLKMADGGLQDDKVLAVPLNDPRYEEIRDISDLPRHSLREITYLFETYKVLEGKRVETGGWEGVIQAKAAIRRAQERYRRRFTGAGGAPPERAGDT